ncbi:MAG: hypothetical protein CTY31_11945 [Hyphomicrobium sp.]|nr:MAG: hypothetical protein CTY31_11945 [Hyphomicrobium sp.]
MTTTPDLHANLVNAALTGEQNLGVALAIRRGVQRMLADRNCASLAEFPLGNGRRADVISIGSRSEIEIIEIKSCIGDYRSDRKWPEYQDYCDCLYFAVDCAFPLECLPADVGIICADAYGAEVIRGAPITQLAAARRKAVLLSFARTAATRLHNLTDPTRTF